MALIAGSFGRTLRSARRTPTACQGPVVLSRGDFEATRLAAPKSRVPGHVPHLVSHLVAHHVVPGPIRVDSCHSWAILFSSVCSVCSVDCLLLSAFRSLLVAFEGMFQTSEASRRSRGIHGGACHGVVLEQSDKRRRTRSSAARIKERNIQSMSFLWLPFRAELGVCRVFPGLHPGLVCCALSALMRPPERAAGLAEKPTDVTTVGRVAR
jgi:hypothetical protein